MYIFVLNYSDQKQEIWMKKPAKDMDTKEQAEGQIFLDAYETKVYEIL